MIYVISDTKPTTVSNISSIHSPSSLAIDVNSSTLFVTDSKSYFEVEIEC